MIISKKFDFFWIGPVSAVHLLSFAAFLESFGHVSAEEKHKDANARKYKTQRCAAIGFLEFKNAIYD